MGLAENIRRLRQQKQLSQPALADKAGVSKGYVYLLESKELTNPSLDILLKIANALDSTIAELIDEPRVAMTNAEPDIPESLLQFIRQRRKAGHPLREDDILSLARMQFRGKRPDSVGDWAYLYEFLERTFDRKNS
ncbi:MAG TPA: helix-turn-helix transcriptional regulator [Tepidisphaeraceae bacterium]|jgi:transcriptional regulator with XRE-family HTH domain|nr:helix-turn-helix transcriptional regulator [Tepidisphaeraceae bacterium]